jgi:excisionase family DNA binding protein
MDVNYLTVAEVADLLRVSDSTIRRSIRSGRLDVYRVGKQGQIRISRDQLDNYLASMSSNGHNKSRHLPRVATRASEVVTTAGEIKGSAWKIINADVIEGLREIADESVHCIVTSPPYYWQRDYEVAGQIGHEESISGYVSALQAAFHEARRVLHSDGVLFLNIGDTYYNAKGRPHGSDRKHRGRQLSRRKLRAVDGPGLGLPRKSLLGIPWRIALALQADGWVLRSSIIWQRPAPMPEPTAHDRPWRTHEPIFLFSKSPRYWFNREGLNGDEDIWRISARPYNPGSHFAPFPLELADRCIHAGCPSPGTVLDPFLGSGTTMLAALARGRSAIGVELKAEYCKFVCERLRTCAAQKQITFKP